MVFITWYIYNPFDTIKERVSTNYKISNYSVQTKWSTVGESGDLDKDYYEDGFYHNIPLNVSDFNKYYIISGTVTNFGNRSITMVLDAVFYDADGVKLFKGSDYSVGGNFNGSTIIDLSPGGNKTFSFFLQKRTFYDSIEYFDNVESFKWAITIS